METTMDQQDTESAILTLPFHQGPEAEGVAGYDGRGSTSPEPDLPWYGPTSLPRAFETPGVNGRGNTRVSGPPAVQIEIVEDETFAVSAEATAAEPLTPAPGLEPSPEYWGFTARDLQQIHNVMKGRPRSDEEFELAVQAAATRHQETRIRTWRAGTRSGNHRDREDIRQAAQNTEAANNIVKKKGPSKGHNTTARGGVGKSPRHLCDVFAQKMNLGDKKKRMAENRKGEERCEVEEDNPQKGEKREAGDDMGAEDTDVDMEDE